MVCLLQAMHADVYALHYLFLAGIVYWCAVLPFWM